MTLKPFSEADFRVKWSQTWEEARSGPNSGSFALLFLTECHAKSICDVPDCKFIAWKYMRNITKPGHSYRIAAIYRHNGALVYGMTSARMVAEEL